MPEPTPLRPDEQVAGGFVAMRLGGKSFNVKALPMALNRKWTSHLADTMRDVLGHIEPIESADQVARLLAQQATTMMDLLIAYDDLGDKVLPEREWIDTTATDTECYEAMKRVTAAAYPFAPDLLRIVPELVPTLIEGLTPAVAKGAAAATIAMASWRSTSGSRPSTAGPLPTSKPTSPTSSLRSTPRKPRSGARRKPSRS